MRVGLSVLLAAALCAGAVWVGVAGAQETSTYNAQVDGQRREFSLIRNDLQGVTYVSLTGAAAQLGATAQLQSDHVAISFRGQTATLTVNSDTVGLEDSRLALEFPVVARNGDLLIAEGDLLQLLRDGFETPVEVSEVLASPDSIPEPVAAAPLEELPPAEPNTPRDITQRAQTQPLNRVDTVVIDPGHGGFDTGFVSPRGLEEKALTLALAQALADELKRTTELSIHLTREGDEDLSQEERGSLATARQGDVLISLHAGVSRAPEAAGVGIYYMPDDALSSEGGAGPTITPVMRRELSQQSRTLARAVADAVPQSSNAALHGVSEVRLRLFDGVPMPGILIEVGFLTNADEEQALSQADYRQRLAQGIAAALRRVVQDS